MPLTHPLAGKTIVVTRPLAQAQTMLEELESKLATTVHFPVLDIRAMDDVSDAKQKLTHLDRYQIVIFISANAVHYAIPHAENSGRCLENCELAAVGPATSHALQHYGYSVKMMPQNNFNSEALLAHAAFTELKGKNILIVRGRGGREYLRETLQSRGACVDYAQVYQRQLPDTRNPIPLNNLVSANCAVLLCSTESAQNLWTLCTDAEQQWLKNVKFVVGSQRIAEVITRIWRGNDPIIADDPGDQAMLDTLIKCFQGS